MGADVNWREFGDFLKLRGPYLEWHNTHPNTSVTYGHSANTDTKVNAKEFHDLIAEALKLGINPELVKRRQASSPAVAVPVPVPMPAQKERKRINVLVAHYNRTNFLVDMMSSLSQIQDPNFILRIADFATWNLLNNEQIASLLERTHFKSSSSPFSANSLLLTAPPPLQGHSEGQVVAFGPTIEFIRLNRQFSKGWALQTLFDRVPASTPDRTFVFSSYSVHTICNGFMTTRQDFLF